MALGLMWEAMLELESLLEMKSLATARDPSGAPNPRYEHSSDSLRSLLTNCHPYRLGWWSVSLPAHIPLQSTPTLGFIS